MMISTYKLSMLHHWGGERPELSAERTREALAHTCFAGGSVIWNNIFGKQFAYHRVIKMFKPCDLVILHVGLCPKEIVQKNKKPMFIHPNVK